jgi:site-specific DNA-methyltransferase (adenine-specific)
MTAPLNTGQSSPRSKNKRQPLKPAYLTALKVAATGGESGGTEMTIDLRCGDALALLKEMPEASVDAVVTDPPYGLKFMGKEWDHGIPGVAFWTEAMRVAKPGAHLLAFGGTRTFHRLTCAIEDAGWEIRDCLMWLYGSGFPKSHNVGKAFDREAGVLAPESRGFCVAGRTDANLPNPVVRGYVPPAPATASARQWSGWGTALKPAWEPVIMARKPLIGTVAENVARYGTGAINVDGCRIGTDGGCAGAGAGAVVFGDGLNGTFAQPVPGLGRWPANVVHDGSEEVVTRFPDADGMQRHLHNRNGIGYGSMSAGTSGEVGYSDYGSASRFFYCAKASRSERGEGNNHPTVKPVALMQWLCRLVTPPAGVILDPFMGSGSTGIAADREGFSFIGFDLSPEYVEIARRRISADAPLFNGVAE